MKICKCDKEQEINDMHTKIDSMNTKLDIIYVKLMGNGRPGLIEQWNRLQGGLIAFKIMATLGLSSGVVSIILFFMA